MKPNFLPLVLCTKYDGIKLKTASLSQNTLVGGTFAGLAVCAVKAIDSFVKKQPKKFISKTNLKSMGIITLAGAAVSFIFTAIANKIAKKDYFNQYPV